MERRPVMGGRRLRVGRSWVLEWAAELSRSWTCDESITWRSHVFVSHLQRRRKLIVFAAVTSSASDHSLCEKIDRWTFRQS